MNRRAEATRERAQIVFALYLQMGPDRSLKRLQRQLQALGVHLSIATIKRYSDRFRWQDHLAELEASSQQRRQETGIEQVVAMQDRHAQLARAVQAAGGTALQRLIASDARLAGMRPADIARLLELGFRAERQALGEAADRKEIAVSILNLVTVEMVRLFREISEESDPEARAREFARGVDRFVDERLATLDVAKEAGDAR